MLVSHSHLYNEFLHLLKNTRKKISRTVRINAEDSLILKWFFTGILIWLMSEQIYKHTKSSIESEFLAQNAPSLRTWITALQGLQMVEIHETNAIHKIQKSIPLQTRDPLHLWIDTKNHYVVFVEKESLKSHYFSRTNQIPKSFNWFSRDNNWIEYRQILTELFSSKPKKTKIHKHTKKLVPSLDPYEFKY